MSVKAMSLAQDFIERTSSYLPTTFDTEGLAIHTALRQAIEQAQKQEPVGFDKTVLDEWTKEYKVEVAYWKAKHDELLRILKQNAEPWVQEPVGVVTGCAEHGEFFTAVFRSKTEVLVDTKIYTSPPQRQPWVSLSDEQIKHVLWQAYKSYLETQGVDTKGMDFNLWYSSSHLFYSKALQDKLRELNGAPQRKPLADEMVLAGARALAKRHADSCGLDFDDVWKYYADEHKDDAKVVIEAAHGIKGEA